MGTKNLILVTGMPRSGTTAVGEVLASAPRTGLLHEPLNYLVGLSDVPHYFAFPGGGGVTESSFDRWVADIRALRLHYKPGVFPREEGLRRQIKRLWGGRAISCYRRCKWTPGLDMLVWKDPFACLAGRYLHEVHGIPVVVTLRNPWAVAASFKRMRWAFDLDDIVSRIQSAGHEKYSFPMGLWRRRDQPVVNAALLWSILYGRLQDLMRAPGGIIGLSLDELIGEPIRTYRVLFDQLGLLWTKSAEKGILRRYQRARTAPQVPASGKAHDRKRDLDSINLYWNDLLEFDEQALVSDLCGELWEVLDALRMVSNVPVTESLG